MPGVPGYEVFNAKSRILALVCGARDFGFKTSRPLGKHGKVSLSGPLKDLCLGYVFFASFGWESCEGTCFLCDFHVTSAGGARTVSSGRGVGGKVNLPPGKV